MTVDLMSCNVNTIERVMERLFRIEYATVIDNDPFHEGYCGVQCRDDPNGLFWNTVTVRIRATKTRVERQCNTGNVGTPDKVLHYYCNVLQRYNQKFGGTPYTPRIGDTVAVLFVHNQKPLVLGVVLTDTQDPVCRAPFNPKSATEIDARYDKVTKWCQWEPPIFNANKEVTEQFPGKHPICDKTLHKNRDQMKVTDCLEGNESACKCCTLMDHVKRCGNQWEKIYSSCTDSKDCEHPYIPVCGVELSKRRHEFHEPCGSYLVFQNNGCDQDYGKGLIRLGNATCEGSQKGHLNIDPKGTIDLHTKHETHPYATEHEGTRMSVVALDDTTVDHSFEAIDFNTDSWIEILKKGDIKLHSLTNTTYIDILGSSAAIIEYAPSVIEQHTQLVHNFGSEQIDGFCTHAGCSCDSDKRLKTNIIPINSGLNEILKFKPITFTWKKDEKHITYNGLIAQEVQEIVPNVVRKSAKISDETPDGTLSINYEGIIPILIKAVQELSEKVTKLEEKIKIIEGT